MPDMKTLSGGRRERMTERFLKTGFDGFQPFEVLEVFLSYSNGGDDAAEKALALIGAFGSVAGVFDADVAELVRAGGLTVSEAALFKMIPQCIPVYYGARSQSETYENTEKLKELFEPYFIGLTREETRIACFDNSLKVTLNEVIHTGAPSSTSINVRNAVECIIRAKSDIVAVAHNHPKTDPCPSGEDIAATRIFNNTLKTMGVKLLDHIIVGANSTYSMREFAVINVFD